ncbi:hypothetical protein Hdeb2414_s0011g00364371 [Helianthus debilis subsp. tardiflorus]
MAPFSLWWLYAELPSRTGNRQETLDRFYALLHFVREKTEPKSGKDSSGLSDDMWRKREGLVINSIISHHLRHKEFGVCLDLIKDLVSRDSNPVAKAEYQECIDRENSDMVAINKYLCLMYLRDLSDSIKVLESVLEWVPTAALKETFIVNLCSMYELAYVNHSDIKKTLSSWIAHVAPDDFDTSCTLV